MTAKTEMELIRSRTLTVNPLFSAYPLKKYTPDMPFKSAAYQCLSDYEVLVGGLLSNAKLVEM